MSEIVEAARHRIEVLTHESGNPDNLVYVTRRDHHALRVILEEIHRLHLVVSSQRSALLKLETEKAAARLKKRPHRKPAAARSRAATAHNTPPGPATLAHQITLGNARPDGKRAPRK